MNSQTARRPDNKRATRTAKTKKYIKQTAHVGARRDGQPLIFGWGGHLSRYDKIRLQRRAIWTVTTLIILLIIGIFVSFWVNINVINPNRPITTVNGQGIPQSDYRKMVAVQAQFHVNALKGPKGLQTQRDELQKQVAAQQKIIDDTNKKITDLDAQIKKLPAGSSAQRTDLEQQLATAKQQLTTAQTKHSELNTTYQLILQNDIPQAEQLYTQPQVGNDSADWLQQDALIRQWLTKQDNNVRTQIEPAPSAIKNAVNTFISEFPKSTTYQQYLNDNRLSNADVEAMLAVQLRRENMQKYLASQIKSPAPQVLARAMTLKTQADAEQILERLNKGEDFGKLAKEKSEATTTKEKGGDLGWLAAGQYTLNYAQNVSGIVDRWIFDPNRKLYELSPVLLENGTYHVVQIMGGDPERAIEAQTLQDLQNNALTAWILSQKAAPGMTITPVDQNMLLDPNNMPPGLPISAPQQNPQDSGLPIS